MSEDQSEPVGCVTPWMHRRGSLPHSGTARRESLRWHCARRRLGRLTCPCSAIVPGEVTKAGPATGSPHWLAGRPEIWFACSMHLLLLDWPLVGGDASSCMGGFSPINHHLRARHVGVIVGSEHQRERRDLFRGRHPL